MTLSLDVHLLKSFLALARVKNFTNAAQSVGRTQSALSLQMKKLEEGLGCSLFDRGGRRVQLTPQGEIFLGYAQRILDLQWEAVSRMKEPDAQAEIRLGTPEDFATHHLPHILANFRQSHPRIQLTVSCEMTVPLLAGFDRGAYDVVLVKRDAHRYDAGVKVWRERLVWGCSNHMFLDDPLPLVLTPPPCLYRARALDTLDKAKKRWRVAYTSPSLLGTIAAVKAGLGMAVFPADCLPEGVRPVPSSLALPELPDGEIALIKAPGLCVAGQMLCDHIMASLGKESRHQIS